MFCDRHSINVELRQGIWYALLSRRNANQRFQHREAHDICNLLRLSCNLLGLSFLRSATSFCMPYLYISGWCRFEQSRQLSKKKNVISQRFISCNWPRGVTVSTLDSESSDRGSNPREAFLCISVPANFAATICFENSATTSHLCTACSHATLRRQQSFYFAHCPTIRFVPAQLSRQSARRYP